MRFCKRGRMELDSLVVIVIVILILILIIFLIFNNNILSWFGNLPGYNENKDKTVDKLDKDLEIKLNYYKVAVVNKDKISFCTNGDCSVLRNSNLYIEGSEDKGIIYISEKDYGYDFLNRDDRIGVFINKDLILDPGYDTRTKEKEGLPLKEDLINLHKSFYISGILYRDKKISLKNTNDVIIDESKNIVIIFQDSFEIPIRLRYKEKWQWSEFFNQGEWLSVSNKEHLNAKELMKKDIEVYNFIFSLGDLNYEEGFKLIIKEILKKKGKNPTRLSIIVDGIDNTYDYDSNTPELGNYAIFIRSIGAEKYEN
ncbi:MAG: hypothetical protein AABW83_02290, partial [Nanoarchaeota archaeon]